jgi:acyl-CoA synthetase (NDP forming)
VADQPVPAGAGVVVVGNSDGAVSLAADACVEAGLDLVPVEVAVGDGRVLCNPIDLSYLAGPDAIASALAAVSADERVHSVLVVYTPPRLDWDPAIGDVVLDAAAAAPTVTFAATMLGAAGRARLWRGDTAGPGVPIFRFPEDAARAIGRLAGYRAWRDAAGSAPLEEATVGDVEAARTVLEPAVERVGTGDDGAVEPLSLDEQDAVLDAYGIEVIPRRLVRDLDAAVAAADELGWPVALKAAVRNRLTRSTASGVVLDIADEAQLRATWERMHDALGTSMLPAVVQRFADSGLDVAVRVRRDDDGSGTVLVGLGGPAAIADERELAVLPLSLADASSLVATSPVGRVLTDPLDRVPIVELVHRLAALVEQHDGVRELDADPVVASPMWARVADLQLLVGAPVDDFAVRRLE